MKQQTTTIVKPDAADLLIVIDYAQKALRAANEAETALRIACRVAGREPGLPGDAEAVAQGAADLRTWAEKALEKA